MAYITDENGNYKRTVRCGHCYEKGHNKGSCPKRKVDLAERIEKYEERLTDKALEGWNRTSTENYLERTRADLNKMLTKGQNRKCGFCNETGHNRSTCPTRKTQVADKTATAILLRKGAAERMIADGFGPGSLVSVADPRDTTANVLAIVTKIDFETICPSHKPIKEDYFNGHRGLEYQYIVPMEDRWGSSHTAGTCYVPLKYMNIDDIPENEWYRNPVNSTSELLSGVEVSEDQLLSNGAVNEKIVSKWINANVVDPK
tara:strand:- start:9 stop:785 length:777 start_codon:yes stop_codon:yes gene_type:complete